MTQVTIDIDDGAIPEGWEPERFGIPKERETIVSSMNGKVVTYVTQPQEIFLHPEMIIRKKYDPGIDFIPKGWWVWNWHQSWTASKVLGEYTNAIVGLQNSVGFIAPEDGKPQQIK
jgi:hypothetical protein